MAASAISIPIFLAGYRDGRIPKPDPQHPRCPNLVRYEMLTRLGYFVTESSEHFAEYTPWFIKRDRPDLIQKFGIPLDEYPKRCVEQIERWSTSRGELSQSGAHRRDGEPRICLRDRQLGVDRRALGHLWQSAQQRRDLLASR